jgi:peptidoglycan/LPS O-acetylase OafA/YrhL
MYARTTPAGGLLTALTSIRFLAALAVVVSHYFELGLLHLPREAFEFFDGGRTAVSLFFVLSGFILTCTYRTRLAADGPRAFYVARVARIYPVMLLGVALVALVTALLVYRNDAAHLLQWFSLRSPVNVSLTLSLVFQLLLLYAWFPVDAVGQPWNGPSDSVSCLAFFYAVFPLLLRRLAPVRGRGLALAFVSVWLGEGLAMLLIAHALPASHSGLLAVALPLLRIAEFAMGMCAALAFAHLRARPVSRHVLGVALVSFAMAALAVLASWHPVPLAFSPQVPLFAALVLGLALIERPVIGLLCQPWLVRLGEASYALCLIHVPLACLAILAGAGRSNGWMVLALAICASLMVLRFYEEPMRRRIHARFSQGPAAGVEERWLPERIASRRASL